jgi:Surface antigen variable number repeat
MLHLLAVGFVALVPTPEVFAEARGARYGTIRIVGNADTPDRIILKQLGGIAPGAKVSAAQLRAARKRLAALGAFRESPTVLLLVNEFDSALVDLRIAVEEQPGNWFTFGLWRTFRGGIETVARLDLWPLVIEAGYLRRRWLEEIAP